MPSGSIATLVLTAVSQGAIPAARFVTQFGTLPTAAGGRVLGLNRMAALGANESLAVDVHGTSIAECGATIAADQILTCDALGRAVPTSSGKIPNAMALEAGTVGQPIEVLLMPTANPTA